MRLEETLEFVRLRARMPLQAEMLRLANYPMMEPPMRRCSEVGLGPEANTRLNV